MMTVITPTNNSAPPPITQAIAVSTDIPDCLSVERGISVKVGPIGATSGVVTAIFTSAIASSSADLDEFSEQTIVDVPTGKTAPEATGSPAIVHCLRVSP